MVWMQTQFAKSIIIACGNLKKDQIILFLRSCTIVTRNNGIGIVHLKKVHKQTEKESNSISSAYNNTSAGDWLIGQWKIIPLLQVLKRGHVL